MGMSEEFEKECRRRSAGKRRNRGSSVSKDDFAALGSMLEVQLGRANLQRLYEREEEEVMTQHLNEVADRVREMAEEMRREVWERQMADAVQQKPLLHKSRNHVGHGNTRQLKVPKVCDEHSVPVDIFLYVQLSEH